MTLPAEIDMAYIAGFFDGEGCVGIYYRKKNKDRNFVLQIALVQNASPSARHLLGSISLRFGGYVASRYPAKREALAWTATGLRAYYFLSQICPYLRLKKEQAEVAMAWQAGRPQPNAVGGKYVAYTEEQVEASMKVAAFLKLTKRETLPHDEYVTAMGNARIASSIATQPDLVEVVATLKQVVCVKG